MHPESDTQLNPPPAPATPGRSVTREEVRHVAALASLDLTAKEEEQMERDLNAILGYIAELNQLDTSQIAPMAQVSEVLGEHRKVTRSALREDIPVPSLQRKTVMAEAPASDGTFFKVPKVIER